MSEEKMREAFEGYLAKGGSEHFDIYANVETFAAGWQAALQESEAGAVACWRVVDEKGEPQTDWVGGDPVEIDPINKDHKVQFAYLAPPSAQAIETAAIMRAAAAVACPGRTIFDTEKAILALIPQDGRTALEKFGMKVATETRSAVLINTREDLFTEDSSLRAIVKNLIGAAK